MFLILAVISSIVLANALLLPCRANLVPVWPDQVVLPFLVRIISYVKFLSAPYDPELGYSSNPELLSTILPTSDDFLKVLIGNVRI